MGSIALVTMLNKAMLIGFKVFLKSFLFHNPWFNYDLVIFDLDLTPKVKKEIEALYKNVVFKKINLEKYKEANMGNTADRLKVTFYKLDTFSLYEYDRVVFIDVDTVVLGDLSELFNCPAPIAAVKGYTEKTDSLRADVNAGVFVVNHQLLNEQTYNALLEIEKKGYSMPEQKTMNIYFSGKMAYFNKSYNVEKRMEHTKNFKHILEKAKIIHYVAGKPWDENDPEKGKYPKMEAIWREWYGKDIN